jgi:hypothetical protein
MSAKLRFVVRSLTVPPSLPHKTRAEEIEELPKYLEVAALIAPELVLMNMGEQEPGADRADFPWIKLNSNGEPLGLFVNVGGSWEPAFSKYMIKDAGENTVIERGSFSLVLTGVGPGVGTQYSSSFSFQKPFDTAPDVFFTITGGTLLTTAMTLPSAWNIKNEYSGGAGAQVWPGTITDKEFIPFWISPIDLTSDSKTLDVTWMAIGTREET